MFYKNSSLVPRLCAAMFCASLILNAVGAGGQTKQFSNGRQNFGGAPLVRATLTDAFPDPDGDGRAAAGEEVTYTARITNGGDVDATGVNFTAQVDGNSTLVANSVQVQPDLNPAAIRCTFSAGSADCNGGGGAYAATDSNLNTILSGQNDYLTVNPSNVSYNAGTGVFQFDVTVQNLVQNSLGTLDGATPDAAGVRLFLQNARVTSGTGSIGIANADGTGTFTGADQPYFQYNEILQQNQVSSFKTVRVNVPNTVGSFALDFFVSTKVELKLVINEVLVNPGGTITDANGEWFELYNAGRFPVDLKNFLINDSAATQSPGEECFDTNRCYRPPFTVATSLPITSGEYLVFGNTTDTTLNGGVPVDYAYGSAMALANSLDAIRIRTPAATGALKIDMTQYSSASVSAQNGISRELKNPTLDNLFMDGSNWSNALVTSVYGSGGRGTPKAQNGGYVPFAEPVDDKGYFEKRSIEKVSLEKRSVEKNVASDFNLGSAAVTANLGTITPGGFATVTYRVIINDPVAIGATQVAAQGSVSGSNFASVVTDDPSTAAANDATVTPIGLAPTAASVSIGGRVITPLNFGFTSALVTLTDSTRNSRTAFAGKGGRFYFNEVAAGETYILSVRSKRYRYATRVIMVNEDMTDLNFSPQ